MKQPALIIEKAHDFTTSPILVVDKEGLIGDKLIDELKEEGTIVYVTASRKVVEKQNSENVVCVPFLKKIPTIPENRYSYIFIVDDKGILRESLGTFLKKIESDKSSLIFITSIFDLDKKLVDRIKNNYSKSKVIIHGDVFNTCNNCDYTSPVNKLICSAQKHGKVGLPADGTRLLYPVSEESLIKGILESTFGSHKEERIFCLFPKDGITYLSFAHLLQKHNPLLKIDFIKEKKAQAVNLPLEQGSFSVVKHNDLVEDIKKIALDSNQSIYAQSFSKKRKKSYFGNQRKESSPFFYAVLFIFLLCLMPFITTLGLTVLGVGLLQNAKNNFTSGNLNFAFNQAKLSYKTFTLASRSIKPLRYELSFLKKDEYVTTLEKQIETGRNISAATAAFLDASTSFSKVISGKAKNQEEEFNNAVNSVKNATSILQKEINKKTLLEDFDKKIERSLNFISSTIDLWPTLAGFYGEKTYLILLQNNMELRPGGGFIGSYGLLTMDKGKLLKFQINDVYNADGQLKAHIEPQFPLRRYLLVKHLFLRDSNFDIDFRNSASQAAVIFNQETGDKIDGVIGVDLSVVKNILNSIGEVNVKDYNEKVNSENLFYITESHAEKGFFPGSTQKKDFLRSLYESIVAKLLQEKSISYLSLLDGIVRSIEEKHLLFSFDNLSIQNLFTVNGWSSAIWDERKESQDRINDFLGIIEANLGGNKVNYFVSKSVSQQVLISKNKEVEEELTITYKNDSDGSWPGGDYKNYLRLILPKGTTLKKITVDGKEQEIIEPITDPAVYEENDFEPPKGLEVTRTEEMEKDIYGFFVTIPKGKLAKITVSYSLVTNLDPDTSSFIYSLKVFKQPGVDSFPYDLTVKNESGYKIISRIEGVVSKEEKDIFEKNIVKDESLSLKFAKQ